MDDDYTSDDQSAQRGTVPVVQRHPRPEFVRPASLEIGELHVDPETAPKKGGRPRKNKDKTAPIAAKLEAEALERAEMMQPPEPEPDVPQELKSADEPEKHEYSDYDIAMLLVVGVAVGAALTWGIMSLRSLGASAPKPRVKIERLAAQ